MATLERSNAPDAFTPTENGDALPEEKALSIDYSEDLWLANSEDSSGPYAQQAGKVASQIQVNSNAEHVESPQTYARPSGLEQAEAQPNETSEDSSNLQQPSAGYVNGELEERNGSGLSGSGGSKDFAQLVPAGSYVEGSVASTDVPDKTFTALMPAAALGVNGEIHQTFTTMLQTEHPQVVYYGSGEQVAPNPETVMASENVSYEQPSESVPYDQSAQMAAASGDVEAGVGESGNAYVAVGTMAPEGQAAAGGNFTVLSPAMMNMNNAGADEQAYPSSAASAIYHNISTLPFVQNGTYPSQAVFSTSYDSNTTVITTRNGEGQQPLAPCQASDYGSDQPTYVSDGSMLNNPLDHGAIDYRDDDDDDSQDQDTSQDMSNSGEMSEFMCPVCSEPFTDQATLDEHVTNHPPLKTFVCETCGKGFATRRYLKYHRKNHCKRAGSYEGRGDLDENDPNCEVKRFTCNICSRPFRVLKCMKVHKKKKHGIIKEHTCHNCAVTFATSQALISHPCDPPASSPSAPPPPVQYTPPPPLAFHGPRKKKKLRQAKPSCDICGKTFADRISVDIHRVKHIEEELYPCDMCDDCDPQSGGESHLAVYFRIKFFTDDNQHILEDQKAASASTDPVNNNGAVETPVHDNEASLSVPSAGDPVYLPATHNHIASGPGEVHILNHSNQSVQVIEQAYSDYGMAHQVDEGNQAAVPNYVVKQYVDKEEGEVPLMSANQGVVIGQQQQSNPMMQQEQIYDQEPAAVGQDETVDEDGADDSLDASGKKKVKRPKTHSCDICNKSFVDSAKLELHYKSNHLEDRPFQCDVCDKSFFTKWKLQRHMLSHLEQKPHSCPMCSKSFVERGKLEAHYRTHLGTKPFKCEHCQKAFTVKSQLTIHVRRIHSTDQPFACLECGKAFLWKSGLDKHMRKHTREKPYCCEVCSQKYSNKSNLVMHMSKVHNQTFVDSPGQ